MRLRLNCSSRMLSEALAALTCPASRGRMAVSKTLLAPGGKLRSAVLESVRELPGNDGFGRGDSGGSATIGSYRDEMGEDGSAGNDDCLRVTSYRELGSFDAEATGIEDGSCLMEKPSSPPSKVTSILDRVRAAEPL